MAEQEGQPPSPEAPAPRRSLRRGWLSVAGAGLAMGGVATAIAALTIDVAPGRAAFPALGIAAGVIAAIALVTVAVSSIQVWRDRDRVTLRRRRTLAIYGAILVALCGGAMWWQATIDLAGGLLTLALPLYAAALTVAAAGLLLVAVSGTADESTDSGQAADEHGQVRMPARIGGVILSAVVAGTVAVIPAVLVERAPVDATTAERVEPVVIDAAPSRVLWQWVNPTREPLYDEDVVSTPVGVAVNVGDGVIALDGRTGTERWHYRRDGAEAFGVTASPSGDWVLAHFRAGNTDEDGPARLVAFDGQTGEIGFDEVVADPGPFGVRANLTDQILLGRDDELFVGYSLADDERLWDWQIPERCSLGGGAFRHQTTRSTVIFALACLGEEGSGDQTVVTATFIALDDSTGAEVWRREETLTLDEPIDPELSPAWNAHLERGVRTQDGTVVRLGWHLNAEDEPYHSVLVEASTGEELASRVDPAARYDATGLLTQPGDEFTHQRLDGTRPRTMPSPCQSREVSPMTVDDALVIMCIAEDRAPVTVAVTPWDDPSEVQEFGIALGPLAVGATEDVPSLERHPTVITALLGGGTQLLAIG